MANPLSRIYITHEGDIVVTDLWQELAEKLSPHFKGEEEGISCPVPTKGPAKEKENG